jgi:hypothetical protein
MNKFKKLAGLSIVLTLLLILWPMTVLAQTAGVTISDGAAAETGTDTVQITITDVTDLGAVDIWLYYDNTVAEVSSVSVGNMGALTVNIDNTAGVTKINWYDAEGLTGTSFTYANVTLTAVGTAGDDCDLDLYIEEFVDTSAVPITPTVTDGVFTITGGTPPPAVGGTAYLPNTLNILFPWIALAVILAATIGWLGLRRRQTKA